MATALGVAAIGGALVGLIGDAVLDPQGTAAFVGYKAAVFDPLLVVPVAVGLGVAVAIAGYPSARWATLATGVGSATAFWLLAGWVSVAAGAVALSAAGGVPSETYYHYYRLMLPTKWVVWSALETALLVVLVLGARVIADRLPRRGTEAALAASIALTVLVGLVYAAVAINADRGLRLAG